MVGVEFGEEPGALSVGGEKFDDGFEVEGLISPVDCGALRLAVVAEAEAVERTKLQRMLEACRESC